jgi:transposase
MVGRWLGYGGINMPKPYSPDLRSRVIAACDAGESPEAVGPRFCITPRTVYSWLSLRRETGGIAPRPSDPGPEPILAPYTDTLRALVHNKPDATLEEIRAELPVAVSVGALFNMLGRLGLSLKKEGHPRRRTTAA